MRRNVPNKKKPVDSERISLSLPTYLYKEIYKHCSDTRQSLGGFCSYLIRQAWEQRKPTHTDKEGGV